MAYSAYCDTAASTKWYYKGTGSTADLLSVLMSDNAAGVEEADNPGNYQPWANFMTEHIVDADYQILMDVENGDGSTTTNLDILNTNVYCDDNVLFTVETAATVNMGTTYGDYGINGSRLRMKPDTNNMKIVNGGTLNVYGSTLINESNNNIQFTSGTANILMSTLQGVYYNGGAPGNNRFKVGAAMGTINFKRVNVINLHSLHLASAPDTYEDVHAHRCAIGAYLALFSGGSITAESPSFTSCNVDAQCYANSDKTSILTVRNPKNTLTTVVNQTSNTNEIHEVYSCDIHAVRNGVNEATVPVEMLDKDGNTTGGFASTNTAADGTITQQDWMYQKWVSMAETNTVFYPHKITLAKPGLEVLAMPLITKRAPIDFRVELRSKRYPVDAWRQDV